MSNDQATGFFEKTFNRTEKFLSYYFINHRDESWRVALWLILIGLAIQVTMIVPLLRAAFQFPEMVSFWVILETCSMVAVFTMSMACFSKLPKNPGKGISLFTATLILALLSGLVVGFLVGLFALFNGQFRAAAKEDAPDWYKKIVGDVFGRE